MELIRTLLEQQPLMALFLTIAIGYLVGEINIKGFSLGVGAVLFVALGVVGNLPGGLLYAWGGAGLVPPGSVGAVDAAGRARPVKETSR